jgi:hypothetical protein
MGGRFAPESVADLDRKTHGSEYKDRDWQDHLKKLLESAV